jgi:WD40 repeat protein
MKVVSILIAFSLLLLNVTACKKSQMTPQQSGFNSHSAKLATIPDGYEMGEALFSADGNNVAAVARKDGKTFLYNGAELLGPYDDVRSLIFRSGSNDMSFVARKAEKEFVVVNGVEGARNETVRQLFFSKDGRIIYTASRGERSIVAAGRRETGLINAPQTLVAESSDGRKLIYINYDSVAQKGNLVACTSDLTDCVAGKKYDYLAVLKTDSSRSHVACIAGKEGKKTILTIDAAQGGLAEKEGDWYNEILNYDLSEGGRHLTFLALRGNKTILVKDGKEIDLPSFDMPLDLVVSKDGRALLTGVVKDRVLAFIDDKLIGEEFREITSPCFSTDGKDYAFAAVVGSDNSVIVNGLQGPPFDRVVTPRFSPDGSLVAYRARKNNERFVVIADNKGRTVREHPHYEAVWDVAFSPDGKFIGYGVKKGNELWWQVEKLDK